MGLSRLATDLHAAIVAAGVPIDGVSIVNSAKHVATVQPASLQAAAQATIDAFDWSDAAEQKRRAQASWGGDGITNKVRAAILLRASTAWTNGTLTAAERAAIQNVIDNAATAIITALRS